MNRPSRFTAQREQRRAREGPHCHTGREIDRLHASSVQEGIR